MNNYIFPFLWMRDQDEDVLRNEIAKIDECGIKAVCLESRPHPDFGGEGWWRDFDIVLEEAKKRNMKIWILDDAHFPTGQANGMIPKEHPELARKYIMMQHTDCVGPIVQASLDVNLFMTKAFTWMDFGKPVNKPLLDEKKLLSVMAYPVVEDDILGEGAIDLTDKVGKDGWLTADIPAGVWRICVSFETYDFGARNEYINYIDEQSVKVLLDAIYEPHYEHYREEFGKTIAGFFSDEPGFYNVDDFDMNDAIGRKKMALPWSDEMFSRMETCSDPKWKQKLPLLWMDAEDTAVSAAARKEYMEQVSFLYSKNFSQQLGRWCEEHKVEYIGHVIEDNNEHSRLGCGAGHYFRAMKGQHMAGIDTIGGQIIPGNPYASRHGVAYVADGKFNHFGLAKLGASSAQIDPKKKGRLMCESFGAYGWNFGVRSMKWLVDYLLVQGVNHFVPHAFSMADYPDCDCPPHFYARGNNPEFPFFAELMKYTNRMCGAETENEINKALELPVIPLEKLAETLKEQGMYDICTEKEEKNLLYYHYSGKEEIYFLFNTSLSETIKDQLMIRESSELIVWDAWKNIYSKLHQTEIAGRKQISLNLAPYESLILMTNRENREVKPAASAGETVSETDISSRWILKKARSAEYPVFSEETELEGLKPVSADDPGFSGIMRYEKTLEISGEKIVFCPQYIYEAAEVFVNGKSAGKKLTPSYQWDITELCQPGENELAVEVVNTPTRDTMKNPGIFGPDREILEPSGMFGKILIKSY